MQDLPATTSSKELSTSPHAKDPAGLSVVSSSTPQEEEEGREQVLKERKGREWDVLLLGGEGELADRLRKAIAKMKKLDEKLASVTKVYFGVVWVGGWVGEITTFALL